MSCFTVCLSVVPQTEVLASHPVRGFAHLLPVAHISAVPALSSEESLRGVCLSPSEGSHIPFWHQRLRTADVLLPVLYNLQQNKQNHRIPGVDIGAQLLALNRIAPAPAPVWFFFLCRQELGPMLQMPNAQGCCFSGTWFSPIIWTCTALDHAVWNCTA